MNLTSELFRQAVECGAGLDETAITGDRRRAPRVASDLHATIMPFSQRMADDNLEVQLRDLSRAGFAFVHQERLPLGEQFALLLPEDSGRPLVILCTIASWQPLEDGTFAIGANFCRVLRTGQTELPLLLQNAVSGELTEARAAS